MTEIAIRMDIYSHVMAGLQEEAAIHFEEALKPRSLEEPLEVNLEFNVGKPQNKRASELP
jgi:hypothetical protein